MVLRYTKSMKFEESLMLYRELGGLVIKGFVGCGPREARTLDLLAASLLDNVFSNARGEINETALGFAMRYTTEISVSLVKPPAPTIAFEAVKKYLESKAVIWDWDEDVESIGAELGDF